MMAEMYTDFSSSSSESNYENSQMPQNEQINRSRDHHKMDDIYRADSEKDKIVISVIDTGVGITKEDRRKLFKLFGKVTNTRGMNTQGIGLGLVISENIVKCFNGMIGVRSKFGQGSHFAFSILLDKSNEYDEGDEN